MEDKELLKAPKEAKFPKVFENNQPAYACFLEFLSSEAGLAGGFLIGASLEKGTAWVFYALRSFTRKGRVIEVSIKKIKGTLCAVGECPSSAYQRYPIWWLKEGDSGI
ncbi:MAG: hypothetical protein A2126_00745 [Candidatus Woykebacteria bacterium GWB1_45_5]|uniref:Uncharacterized protein n=2 Tax=Candidatus Woykeibacteriota TaxID=1817899 RepID=A0A1G1W3D5_9BACT|nr:MAG: hypothetical protein A2113_03535 [Candidatus Woykebacteria bacterium GWA1_44_8]OGY24362.1 MAG: hypothetical protein A2126_00745 [Candidatus Woykebacteria bacterium GWB1_45_5]